MLRGTTRKSTGKGISVSIHTHLEDSGEGLSVDGSVGAGDACTAALLVGLVMRLPVEQLVAVANRAGAYVASVPGATPALPEGLLGV